MKNSACAIGTDRGLGGQLELGDGHLLEEGRAGVRGLQGKAGEERGEGSRVKQNFKGMKAKVRGSDSNYTEENCRD